MKRGTAIKKAAESDKMKTLRATVSEQREKILDLEAEIRRFRKKIDTLETGARETDSARKR